MTEHFGNLIFEIIKHYKKLTLTDPMGEVFCTMVLIVMNNVCVVPSVEGLPGHDGIQPEQHKAS